VEQILRAEGKGLPVQLVGFVEHAQLLQHLLKCHAVVLLSDYEGLGLALLEGMACGVVPIGLHGAPCVTEFVADSVNGLLVGDRGDEFVAAVRRLRDDPQLWERLARAAHAKAIEFSVAACADHWQELLHTLVNSSGPRQPLQIPRWLHLPPVHPALSWLDPRPNQELMRRARRFAGFLSHFWT
jgi:glycosyltransferase involved in cell wall biosynthesis